MPTEKSENKTLAEQLMEAYENKSTLKFQDPKDGVLDVFITEDPSSHFKDGVSISLSPTSNPSLMYFARDPQSLSGFPSANAA